MAQRYTNILWRLKALRFRGNSYDAGEGRTIIFYKEFHGGCIDLHKVLWRSKALRFREISYNVGE